MVEAFATNERKKRSKHKYIQAAAEHQNIYVYIYEYALSGYGSSRTATNSKAKNKVEKNNIMMNIYLFMDFRCWIYGLYTLYHRWGRFSLWLNWQAFCCRVGEGESISDKCGESDGLFACFCSADIWNQLWQIIRLRDVKTMWFLMGWWWMVMWYLLFHIGQA